MNATQLEFPPVVRASQNDKILALLKERSGDWVPMPELERVSGSHRLNSRAADLRKKGFNVENMTHHACGRVMSFYRLVALLVLLLSIIGCKPEPVFYGAKTTQGKRWNLQSNGIAFIVASIPTNAWDEQVRANMKQLADEVNSGRYVLVVDEIGLHAVRRAETNEANP